MIWLEDYLRVRSLAVDQKVIQAVATQLEAFREITLAELLQQPQMASPNEIYTLIATKQIYVDLEAARLAQPEQVQVFRVAVSCLCLSTHDRNRGSKG